jgi:dienelactone hydrolase
MRRKHHLTLTFEQCEDRILNTLVFVLNGNGFSAAVTNSLTANAAQVLQTAGNRAVQLSYPTIATPAAINNLAQSIRALSHGQPIGIVGFSAGGTLAARLAAEHTLNVVAVLDYYGTPDLRDWFSYHKSDRFASFVRDHVDFTSAGINALSGPINTTAHEVAAFGSYDRNVVASQSISSFHRDLPQASLYVYPGPHGVGIGASPPALKEFLANLH